MARVEPDRLAQGRGGVRVPAPASERQAEPLTQSRVVRTEPDRRAVCGERPVQQTLALEREAETQMSLRVVGPYAQRLGVRRRGLRELPLLEERRREIELRRGERRRSLDGFAVERLRLGRPPLAAEHGAQVDAGDVIVRLHAERVAKRGLGPREVALPGEREPEAYVRPREVGPQAGRLAERPGGGGVLALLEERSAELGVGGGAARLEPDRLAKDGYGVRGAALATETEPEAKAGRHVVWRQAERFAVRRFGLTVAAAARPALRARAEAPRVGCHLLGKHGDCLDFHQQIVAHEARDLDQRRGRPVRAEELAARDVDLFTVGGVPQEHGDLAHVGERRARGREARLEVLVHLAGLRHDVLPAHRASLGVRGDAARDEDEAPRLDDVGEVADGLGHARNPNLFAATQLTHLSLRAFWSYRPSTTTFRSGASSSSGSRDQDWRECASRRGPGPSLGPRVTSSFTASGHLPRSPRLWDLSPVDPDRSVTSRRPRPRGSRIRPAEALRR